MIGFLFFLKFLISISINYFCFDVNHIVSIVDHELDQVSDEKVWVLKNDTSL